MADTTRCRGCEALEAKNADVSRETKDQPRQAWGVRAFLRRPRPGE